MKNTNQNTRQSTSVAAVARPGSAFEAEFLRLNTWTYQDALEEIADYEREHGKPHSTWSLRSVLSAASKVVREHLTPVRPHFVH